MFLWFPPSHGFHPPVVSTFPWLLHGFHPVWLLHELHPPVVCIFAWFPPSRGYSWCPFCGLHFRSLHCHGFHPPVVFIFLWFPPSHGYSMVSLPWFALSWFTLCRGFHPRIGLHLRVVPTLPVVTLWCPFRRLHSAVVSTLLWFASSCGSHPPCGYSVVPLPWFALLWFTLCRGFHPPVVCIFAWFPPSLWLLCGVPFVVCTIMWFTLCRGFHPLVVTLWCPSWILA